MPMPDGNKYAGGAALDDDLSLFADPDNQITLTLDGDIDATTTSFVVNEDISGIEIPTMLWFSTGEIVLVEAKNNSTKTFSTVTRGAGDSTAQVHSDGEEIRQTLTAEYIVAMKQALINIETVLGLAPQGGTFTDVNDRLDDHVHSGGDHGAPISTSDLLGHDKAAHDALGIDAADADTVDGHHGHAPTKAAHDALNIDADTLDGKHFSDLDDGATTVLLGYDGGTPSGEIRALIYVGFNCVVEEVHVRSRNLTVGSVDLDIQKATSDSGGFAQVRDISLSSQSYRTITGLNDSYSKGNWILIRGQTWATLTKVAVGLQVRRT